MSSGAPLLVKPTELAELKKSGVAILDASWHMPASPRKAKDEFLLKRIPGAQFLDLDEVASPNELGLKHMMPSSRQFADACEYWGIEPDTHVVIYDAVGVFSSPRALFMFRAFGHGKSSILDGGLPRWEVEGYPVETGPPLTAVKKTTYPEPHLDANVIRSYKQVVYNASLNPADPISELVLDARSRGRWLGSDPEPRPGLPSGHIPHSFSLPFNTFLQTNKVPGSDATYTMLLPPQELREKLVGAVGPENAEKILKGERSAVTSCGSGMTAGVLWLGLKLLGASKVGLYDESWTGYAVRESSVIDKGEK
ncbi:Rhodanese-like protein [Gloeophyllum trabeum ATCC 11539]|uniref:Rhodanese-like protein n=1 Tax=Gloeophyllum trabeum (strain ATCC 11539 / FP-39264 / Madison 617) TaxID=670483 RepID=S7QN91_GLOTA|nr:Rhodanese-like protein [Gloeophyllum trabeum ATCC 11539]EPQ60927.1 Rhodanese-like protein [Gloeophyllum trabeum ATCC 11539]